MIALNIVEAIPIHVFRSMFSDLTEVRGQALRASASAAACVKDGLELPPP